MATDEVSASCRSSFWMVLAIVGMVAVPAGLTLHTVHAPPEVEASVAEPSPYGYTVSLLLFLAPIAAIALWLGPKEDLNISKRSLLWTMGILFPFGAALDFFFAHSFFTYPNAGATLRILAPALGGGVPVEEYIFYFTGFLAILLLYIWLDEYWLAAYSVPVDARTRTDFDRLLRFHPQSLAMGLGLIGAAILYRRVFLPGPGFPGYFCFLVAVGLGPSTALYPSVKSVINWRALSMAVVMILLISLLWEATLGVPYGWWGFQDAQMTGIRITAWSRLPVEEILVWISVSYATVIVYEVVRRWKSSGKHARRAFFGVPSA